jgi:phosphate transport system protein
MIEQRDDVVDELFSKVKDDVVNLLKQSTGHVDQCIDLLMIAKYLERIGDHAVNVCEWTEFAKTGALKNVRIL